MNDFEDFLLNISLSFFSKKEKVNTMYEVLIKQFCQTEEISIFEYQKCYNETKILRWTFRWGSNDHLLVIFICHRSMGGRNIDTYKVLKKSVYNFVRYKSYIC